PLLSTTTRKG
ncbi:hypothetical protein CPC197_1108B, partial [Chlamydia psittaci C1/97]